MHTAGPSNIVKIIIENVVPLRLLSRGTLLFEMGLLVK